MEKYENYPIHNPVYESIYDLLSNNPRINQEIALIFLINWPYGFGSALSVHIQNEEFLNNMNPNWTVIPHFSNNTRNFKYHDETRHNSFFLYFKNKKSIPKNIEKIYFAKAVFLGDYFRMSFKIPVLHDDSNRRFVTYFKKHYSPILNDNVRTFINSIKRPDSPLIGIHIRSIAQKQMENSSYLTTTFENHLIHLKEKIQKNHPNATIFLATDVELYIKKIGDLFGHVHSLDYIKRIYNEGDSMPQLDRYKGSELGMNIMDDCYALSLCDKIYVSNSNIPFIISLLSDRGGDDTFMVEY